MTARQVTAVSLWSTSTTPGTDCRVLDSAARIGRDGALAADNDDASYPGVTIQAIVPHDGGIAVVFVNAQSSAELVALNGSPVRNGLHLLRHADRLDLAGRSFWVSAESSLRRTQYAADHHGAEVRCGLTKARLREGQAIVICPGVPGTPCGVVYKAQAWDAVITANPQMKCTHCGYRPGQSTWQPPIPKPRKGILDGLRQLTTRR